MGRLSRLKRERAETRSEKVTGNRQDRRKVKADQRREMKKARKIVSQLTPRQPREITNMQRSVSKKQYDTLAKQKNALQEEVAKLRSEVFVLRDRVKKCEGGQPYIAIPA